MPCLPVILINLLDTVVWAYHKDSLNRRNNTGRFISYFRLFGGGIREAFGGVWKCFGGSLLVISTPKFLRRTIKNHYILFLYLFFPFKRPYKPPRRRIRTTPARALAAARTASKRHLTMVVKSSCIGRWTWTRSASCRSTLRRPKESGLTIDPKKKKNVRTDLP